MNKKTILLIIAFLLVLSIVYSKNFVVHEASDITKTYLSANRGGPDA